MLSPFDYEIDVLLIIQMESIQFKLGGDLMEQLYTKCSFL